MNKTRHSINNSDLLNHINNDKSKNVASLPKCALVVSHNQFQKSILVSQMMEMGIVNIIQTSHLNEARAKLENGNNIDLIIFDYEIKKGDDTAQTMLEDLRSCGLISLSTIVIFFSSFGKHQLVSNAAEVGIDVFLLLPYSYKTLHERIFNAHKRRQEFREIYENLEQEDFDGALELCLERYIHRAFGWLYAARIAAEIYIKKGEPKKAQEIYNSILSVNATPWAKVGLGRSQAESGHFESAIKTLSDVIAETPDQTDAYDVMGRAYFEMGEPSKALDIYRMAVKSTPTSVTRLQRLGFASIHAGEIDYGICILRKSVEVGAFSKMFDPRAFFLLAVNDMDNGDGRAINECLKKLIAIMKIRPNDKRIERIFKFVEIIDHLNYDQKMTGRSKLDELLKEKLNNEFDHDSASCLITLLSIFAEKKLDDELDMHHISEIGLRFAHSKFCSAWLSTSALRHSPYSIEVGQSFSKVFKACQESMTIIVSQKNHADGINVIMDFASRYKNIKAIETAEGMVNRYSSNLVNSHDIKAKINLLKINNDPQERRHYPANGYLRHPGGISLPKKVR